MRHRSFQNNTSSINTKKLPSKQSLIEFHFQKTPCKNDNERLL